LQERDGLIVEHLDFGLGNIKGEDKRKKRWVGSAVSLVWDGLKEIDGPWDPERHAFSILYVEIHCLAG